MGEPWSSHTFLTNSGLSAKVCTFCNKKYPTLLINASCMQVVLAVQVGFFYQHGHNEPWRSTSLRHSGGLNWLRSPGCMVQRHGRTRTAPHPSRAPMHARTRRGPERSCSRAKREKPACTQKGTSGFCAPSRTRTDTETILSRLPLPLGYGGETQTPEPP